MSVAVGVAAWLASVGSFLVDAEGNLWVQYYRLQDEPEDWAVFDRDGRWLGDVAVPGDVRITDVGTDYVLGIGRDTLDVEQVRMYRVSRSGVE